MSGHQNYTLNVNGTEHPVKDAWIGESLLYVLRERLGLPGSKGACEQGECGSCTVVIDGNAVCSCLVMAATAVDSQIATIEGLAEDGALTDVQEAFITEGAVQCGFCTPGLVMAVHHLLESNDNPDEMTVKEALSGNICRCTGYGRIFAAVDAVIAQRQAGRLWFSPRLDTAMFSDTVHCAQTEPQKLKVTSHSRQTFGPRTCCGAPLCVRLTHMLELFPLICQKHGK